MVKTEKRKEYEKKYKKEHKKKVQIDTKKWCLKRFNLTLKDYDIMFDNQKERCGICNIKLERISKGTHLDHDHKTNKVRGILCHNCNIGLGMFKDNADFLINTIKWLKN